MRQTGGNLLVEVQTRRSAHNSCRCLLANTTNTFTEWSSVWASFTAACQGGDGWRQVGSAQKPYHLQGLISLSLLIRLYCSRWTNRLLPDRSAVELTDRLTKIRWNETKNDTKTNVNKNNNNNIWLSLWFLTPGGAAAPLLPVSLVALVDLRLNVL